MPTHQRFTFERTYERHALRLANMHGQIAIDGAGDQFVLKIANLNAVHVPPLALEGAHGS